MTFSQAVLIKAGGQQQIQVKKKSKYLYNFSFPLFSKINSVITCYNDINGLLF